MNSRSTRLFLHDPRGSEVDGIAEPHHILYDRMLLEIKLDASCIRASDLVNGGKKRAVRGSKSTADGAC